MLFRSVVDVLMNPRHPFTRLLRDSIPPADPKKTWSDTVSLTELEQDEYLRTGCKFAGRCPVAMDHCKTVVPVDLEIDDVLVRCHLYSQK